MRFRWVFLMIVLLAAMPSCNRDPNVAKRKYLESGNRYFDNGKYKEASIMYRSALGKDARYGEAYYRLGLTSLKLGQPGAALRYFVRAFELLPDGEYRTDTSNKLTDIYLAQFLLDTRRSSSIREDTIAFLKNPKVTAFDRSRLEAHISWRDGNVDKAIEQLQDANRQRPQDKSVGLALVQAMMAKGEADLRQKQGETATRWFDQAVRLAMGMIEHSKDFGPAYDVLYNHYLRRDQAVEAENIRKLKAENNPRNLDYRFQLATHLLRTGRADEAQRIVDMAVADRHLFPNGRERAGDFYMVHRLYDKAIEYYRTGLGGEKEQWLTLQRKIADALMASGRREEALALLEREVLKRFPDDSVSKALRASIWIDSGDRAHLKQAVAELEEAVRKLPKNPALRYNLGRAYWASGQLEPARVQFRAAIDMQADYLPPRLGLCELQLQSGDFAASLQLAEEALALAPANMIAKMLRSQSLQGLGKTSEARLEIEEAMRAHPEAPVPVVGLALLEMRSRNFAAAAKAFENCLVKFPGQSFCIVGAAEAYTAMGQFGKGQSILTTELERNPSRREIRLALANTLVLGGKHKEAAEIYSNMLEKEPDSADLSMRLGETYRRMGDNEGAIKQFQRVKQLQPANVDALVWLALLLHGAGREDEAKQHYQDILRLQPDNAVTLNNLAFIIAEQGGDLDLALTYAQRAKQKLPDVPEVSDTLGWIYIQKKLTSNALTIYDELVAKYPSNPTFRYHRGLALLQKGDRPGARRELEAALRNQPQSRERAKIQETLQRIG